MQFSEIGNYVFLAQLNPERQSKTFKVKHKFTDEVFVLKMVSSTEPEFINTLEKIFKRLSSGISKLKNPHLINFKDYFITEIDDQKTFILVSEFFAGKELHQFLKNIDPSQLSYDNLMGIFSNTCSAIKDAHSINYLDEFGVEIEGFPHGDITPWNIMINNNFDLKLLDFKLSNRFTISEEKKDFDQQVRSNLDHSKSISKSADITQLGYLLYYLFSNNKEYSNYRLEEKTQNEIRAGLNSSILGKQSNKVSEIVYRCTNKESDLRVNSVVEIEALLEGPKKAPAKTSNKLQLALVAMILILGSAFAFKFFLSPSNMQVSDDAVSDTRGAVPKAVDQSAFSAGNYYALMIANENYRNLKKLSRPLSDVNKFKNILTSKYGFQEENIITKYDASRNDIYDGFEQLVKRLTKNDLLLIFYAGHGQLEGDEGYWVPVEAQEQSRRNWISNTEIKHFLGSIASLKVLLISDACFGGSILRDINSYPSGQSRISNKKTRIALTSGSLESVPDHSVFIDQLFWYMENAEDTVVYASNIFSEIREGIASNTTNDPGYGPIQDSGHQGGDFFFTSVASSSDE